MKKLSYILLTLLIVPNMLFVSCIGDTKSSDIEQPKVEKFWFNRNDKVVKADTINKEQVAITNERLIIRYDTLIINNSKNPHHKIDTLVLDHTLRASGIFTDNEGLSTFFVQIWLDSTTADYKTPAQWAVSDDIYYRMSAVAINANMYGKTIYDDTIQTRLVQNIESKMSRPRVGGIGTSELVPVIEGEYLFNVRCIDIAGNMDTTSYHNQKVIIMSEENIKKVRTKK